MPEGHRRSQPNCDEMPYCTFVIWTAITLLFTLLLVTGCAPGIGGSGGPFGGLCVTNPYYVQAGSRGSVYIEDSHGLTHYSHVGRKIWRVPLREEVFTSDGSGGVYYLRGSRITHIDAQGGRDGTFPAPNYQPEAADSHGDVIAVKGGPLSSVDSVATVSRFSSRGKLLSRWRTPYATAFAFGESDRLYANGGVNAGGDMAELDQDTGQRVKLLHRPLGFSFDALAGDPRGNVYIGATTGADAPFTVEKLKQSTGTFQVINHDQEQVSGLAVGSNGNIFVLRSSYSEPGAGGGTGLFELSSSGKSLGKFAFCKKGS